MIKFDHSPKLHQTNQRSKLIQLIRSESRANINLKWVAKNVRYCNCHEPSWTVHRIQRLYELRLWRLDGWQDLKLWSIWELPGNGFFEIRSPAWNKIFMALKSGKMSWYIYHRKIECICNRTHACLRLLFSFFFSFLRLLKYWSPKRMIFFMLNLRHTRIWGQKPTERFPKATSCKKVCTLTAAL